MKIVFCVVLAVLLPLTLLLSACDMKADLVAVTVTDADGNVVTTLENTAPVSYVVAPTLAPTSDAEIYGIDGAQLSLLKTGVFYFKGYITDEKGTKMPMEMACGGDSWYMSSQMDSVSIGMMKSGETFYMVYPDGKCCLELSEKICETMDLDLNELNFDTTALAKSEIDPEALLESNEALLDTQIVTCNTYKEGNGTTKTYVKDGQLLRLAHYDASGTQTNVMDIEILSGDVPVDKLSPSADYKIYSGTTGMLGFMAVMAKSIDFNNLPAVE